MNEHRLGACDFLIGELDAICWNLKEVKWQEGVYRGECTVTVGDVAISEWFELNIDLSIDAIEEAIRWLKKAKEDLK